MGLSYCTPINHNDLYQCNTLKFGTEYNIDVLFLKKIYYSYILSKANYIFFCFRSNIGLFWHDIGHLTSNIFIGTLFSITRPSGLAQSHGLCE